MSLISTSARLFFTKNDPEDPRLGDHFKPTSSSFETMNENDIAIIGYPDDEGIQLNGGRIGAAEAPKTIRQFLYKMSWPLRRNSAQNFWDVGDLEIKGRLESRHEEALNLMTALHQKKTMTVSLGGGHDYGFADAAGFIKNYLGRGPKPMVINFDAHLDVRPTDQGFNSGTPFRRLLTQYADDIDFVEIGLQPQCNSLAHRDWALKKNAHLFDLKDVQGRPLEFLLEKPVFKKLTPTTPVFVSFDMDCMSSSEAGGCSQAWVTGLKFLDCQNFLNEIYRCSNTRGLGLYETSPVLDTDFRTSKTAALFAYYFIFRNLEN